MGKLKKGFSLKKGRRIPGGMRLPFSLLLFFFLGSCASLPPAKDSGAAKLIAKVPFFPQEAYQCGPASLAGVLNYWGVGVTPEEIARAIYSQTARGTLDLDMVFYGEKKGLKAAQYSGSAEDIKKNIDAEIPLIVLVDEGVWAYQKHHFMVVVGYGDQGLWANSGSEPQRYYPWAPFLKTWAKTKNWTLRFTPP